MSALNFRSPRRSARKTAPVRPLGQFVRLEDRTVPDATLVDVARGLQAAGAGDGQILGASPDGRYAIFSSEATNLVIGQVDVPGTRDLFWIDFLTTQTKLVTGSPLIDSANPTQYLYNYSNVAFGYSFNTVEPFSQAVLSDDGKSVAFTSKVNAGSLDSDYATSTQIPALAGVANKTQSRDRGDASYDVFRWDYEAGGKIQLASRTYANAKVDLTQAFGNRADAINPAISGDGSKIAFISARDATAVYPRATATTLSYIIDSPTPTDDLFMVDFEKIVAGDPQNTAVVSQIANPYINSTFIDEPLYFWPNRAATFGFAGSYAPVNDNLFYQLVTITNPDGTTTTQFTGAPIRSGYTENVRVDPAGRYISADGADVAFVSNINPIWTTGTVSNTVITDLNYSARYDVYRSTIVDVGALQAPDHINASIAPGTTFATLASGGGTADNVILSRDTGDRVLFPANTVGTQIVTGATNTQGVMQLYFRPVTRDGALDATIITSTYGSTTSGVAGGLPANTDASLDSVQIDPLSYNLSNDGNFAVFTSSANGISNVANTASKFQVYRRDTRIDTPTEITSNKASKTALIYVQTVSVDGIRATSPGNNNSLYPSVSSDGRFVSYQTLATNVVAGGGTIDTNGTTDIAVRDFAPGATTAAGKAIPVTSLVSLNAGRTATGNGASTKPIQTSARVLFTSLASDLITGTIVIDGTQHVYSVIVPPQAANGGSTDVIAVGGGFNANATLTSFTGTGQFAFGSKFTPFPGFTGEIRVASGDVDGDGVVDLIAGAGPGGGPRVVVISGSTGAVIRNFFAFESSFRGGVTVAAADFNGPQDDGTGTGTLVSYTDVVIGADEGGGARVQVWDGKTGVKRADFFAYESTFRGGVRVGAGDVNGDGTPDIITGAGMGGGPRVSGFDGLAISAAVTKAVTLNTAPARIVDFFAFEATLRNGVYVGSGDINGDGFSEVVVGGGPGGGPRVTAFDGRDLAAGSVTPTLNFFAFPSDSRDGVHVAVRNIDGVGNLDIVAGQGTGQQSRVKSFSGDTVDSSGSPMVLDDQILFGDFGSLNGAWVG